MQPATCQLSIFYDVIQINVTIWDESLLSPAFLKLCWIGGYGVIYDVRNFAI